MKSSSGAQGFLLTEVLIVIIIFSLGMVGALTALNHAMRIVKHAAAFREARIAAEDAVTTIRMLAEVQGADMPTTFPSRTVGKTALSVAVEQEELTAVESQEEAADGVDGAVPQARSGQAYYQGVVTVRDRDAVIYELPFVIRTQKGAV